MTYLEVALLVLSTLLTGLLWFNEKENESLKEELDAYITYYGLYLPNDLRRGVR